MRNIFINPLELLSTAFHAGQVSLEEINAALAKPRGLNMPCGYSYNEHHQSYKAFFSTDKETGAVNRDKNGLFKLNIQPNQKAPKKQQAASTPGAVLPNTQGAPALPADIVAAVALLQASGLQVTQAAAPAQPEAKAEDDFSDVTVNL